MPTTAICRSTGSRSSSSPATCCPRRPSTRRSRPASTATIAATAKGGIIPEEYAVEYVVDRVDTTATVWLGLTLACARCHSHKFDPITQEEFYRFFAFFNNVPENGRAIKFGNSPPMIKTPTRAAAEQLDALQARLRGPGAAGPAARARDRVGPGCAGSRRCASARRSTGFPTTTWSLVIAWTELWARDQTRRRSSRASATASPSFTRGPAGSAARARRPCVPRRRRRRRVRLLRQVHAQRLDQARRLARGHHPLADGRRAAGRGLQRRARPGQGPGQPGQALARRRDPRRDDSGRPRRRVDARRRHLRRLAGRGGREGLRRRQARADHGAARRAESNVPDQGAAADRRRRRAGEPVCRRDRRAGRL